MRRLLTCAIALLACSGCGGSDGASDDADGSKQRRGSSEPTESTGPCSDYKWRLGEKSASVIVPFDGDVGEPVVRAAARRARTIDGVLFVRSISYPPDDGRWSLEVGVDDDTSTAICDDLAAVVER
jgi:hypothetical protein